jgi:ABC-2 type transport system ATP-binding protein
MLIMLDGRILASDTPDNLQRLMSSTSQVVAEIEAPVEEIREAFEDLAEVQHCDVAPVDGGYHRCALTPEEGHDLRPAVFALARDRGWQLRELTISRHSLEDIYVKVTQSDGGKP